MCRWFVVRIGFAGLGVMGFPMARRLLEAGFQLKVYNRTVEKALPLKEQGAVVASSPGDLASDVDVYITMLRDADVVEKFLIGEAFSKARSGTIFIDMSTVYPDFSVKMASEAERRGFSFLDAPVLGNVDAAERGELKILVGGRSEVYEKVLDLLRVMGEPLYLGPSGYGSRVKMIVNHILITTVSNLAEALALTRSLGIKPETIMEIMGKHPTGRALEYYWNRMLPKEARAKFYIELAAKDLMYIVETGVRNRQELPMASTALQTYTKASKVIPRKDYTRVGEVLG